MTTTLRFAATNEVSTLNNAAISNSRITNLARSTKAIVTIKVHFDIDSTQKQIETFRIRVENVS
jgi:small-conductance mechanosensitive channel